MSEPPIDTDAQEPPAIHSIAFYRRRYLAPFLCLLLALKVLSTSLWLGMLVPLRNDLSFPEGALAARAHDVAGGVIPYHDWREWPHQFSPYGPLTYAVPGLLGRALGASDPVDFYLPGRLVSFASLLGICALMFGMLRRLGAGPLWTLAALGAFLAWLRVLTFVSSYRPDAPQVFLGLLSLWIAMGGPPTIKRAIPALACLFLAMWFKPTSWGMIAAMGFWLWRGGGARFAAIGLGAFAGLGLLGAFALDWAWEGRLLLNMIGSLDNGMEPSNLVSFYANARLIPLAILLSGAGIAAAFLARKTPDEPLVLFCFAVLASFAATSLQNLKVGADVNYYLEPYALSCVALAFGLALLWRAEDIQFSVVAREAFFFGLALPLLLYDAWINVPTLRDDLASVRRGWDEPAMIERLRAIEGPALVANPYFALARPRRPMILDHVQYKILVERGRIDDAQLISRIDGRAFGAVLISQASLPADWPNAIEDEDPTGLFSPRFNAAIARAYEPAEKIGPFVLLLPKSTEPTP